MHKVEIERKYLLKGMPTVPERAEVWQVQQGYFSCNSEEAHLENSQPPCGRIRSIRLPNGHCNFTHTIKSGEGLIRQEVERVIDQDEFETLWPMTADRRITKVRHRVQHDGVVWEIDQFSNIELVLAEIELQSPQQAIDFPDWLRDHIVREVTDDPAFTNAAIAHRSSRTRS